MKRKLKFQKVKYGENKELEELFSTYKVDLFCTIMMPILIIIYLIYEKI